jgi:hypothetical protein
MFTLAQRGIHRFTSIRTEQGTTAAREWLVDRIGARLINLGV